MALLRKELHALRPFLWLILIMAALDAIAVLLTEFPDQHSIGDVFDEFDAGFSYLVLFGIAFAIGQSVIGREKSEETLEFLDALPVSRARVYWTKWLAGYLVLTIYLLLGLAFHLPLHVWSVTSEDTSLYTEFWGSMLAMDQVVIAIYLSIGMTLAFWGRFGLLAAAFYLIGIWILGDLGLPGAERFDPLVFGQLNVIGSALIVPWDVVAGQLGVALVLAFLGQFAFDRLGRARSEASGWQRAATPLFIIGLSVAAIAWIAGGIATTLSEGMPDPDAAAEPVYPDWETTRHATRHFTFIYPNNQARAAEGLIAEADAIHEKVTRFFGTEPERELVVDLTSSSPRHAGSAYWGRIRINLDAEGLESRLPAVLGHELSHIYIDQLSDNRTSETFDSTRFFHEGLASLLEYRYFRPADELVQIRRVAAAARDREDLRFEDLVSSAALSRLYAPEWVYPLGEVFTAAITDTWGDEAPAAIVRAFAREDAPDDLAGIELWRDTFQAAGYDLETAIGAYFRLLDEIVVEQRAWLDQLPRLRGRLSVDVDQIFVKLVPTPPEGGKSFVRFRPGPGAAESDYEVRRVRKNGAASISREGFPAGVVDFQIVYLPEEPLMMPIFGAWVSAKLK